MESGAPKRRPLGPAFLGVALGQVLGRPLAFPWNDEKNLNFRPQFLRRKYGNLRNFYVEIASGYCQEIGIVRPIGRTDPFIAFVNSHCTQNRGYTDTFFDCFWFCLITTVKLAVWKQVSDRETQGQNGNSAENRVVTDYGQNNG